MMQTNNAIEAHGLTRHYQRSKVRALDGIDLRIPKGRIVGLIGPNGSGKTTALKAMLGLTPYQGQLNVLGLDPARSRDQLMERVCFIADVATLPRWATVQQLIDLTAGLHPRFDRQVCLDHLKNSNVRLDAKVKNLSRGMVVQAHLALVMAIDAELLVLDEPTLGLDLLFRKQFYTSLINEYFNENRTIVITTHQVEEVEHILTDLVFIDRGKLILNAPMDEVMQDYVELIAHPDQLAKARMLGPIHERTQLGKHILLYSSPNRDALAPLGELIQPTIADLFVALMKHPTTESKQ